MADNVAITAGSGTTVHADEYTHGTLGSGKTQLVKLVDGTLDSDTAITVDVGAKANALRVAPANDITDGTYIGDIKFGEGLPSNDGVDIGDVTVNNAGGLEVVQDTASDLNVTEASAADALTALQTIDDWDSTHDSAASADGPQLMAAYDSTKPTAVGDGDAVRVLADSYGRLLQGVEPEWFNSVYDSADATSEGETVKAATASKKIYITSFIISSDVEGWIKLQDEDSNALTGKFWLKAGGGVSWTAGPGAPLVLNVANKALEVIAEAAGNVSVTVMGYLLPG